MYRLSRVDSGGWHFDEVEVFRTKRDLLAYRNQQIGTDNPWLAGEWDVQRLSVPDTSGRCSWQTIGRMKFIGEWDEGGNSHKIIGQRDLPMGG